MAGLHQPVLLREVVTAIAPRAGGRYIDCTLGDGGHCRALLELSNPDGRVLGLDVDARAIEVSRRNLEVWGERVTFVCANFRHVGRVAREHGFVPADGVVMDLGWSSTQIKDPNRGLSFLEDGPLDMRLDVSQAFTAADLVNTLSEQELAEGIRTFGEERHAERIARAIVSRRPLYRTRELAELIEKVIGRREKIHPATRTFQALRIMVNDELNALREALTQIPDLLAPTGTLAVISFHSLEDRIVKQFLQRESAGCICPPEAPICTCGHQPRLKLCSRKPVRPSEEEIRQNPRARSARLRVARRLAVG